MKKLRNALIALALGAIATVAYATLYPLFGPSTGILKGSATSPQTSAAVSADVIALWSGSCTSGTFLRGDGSCASAGTGGTVTSVQLATPNSTLSIGGTNPITTSGTINLDLPTTAVTAGSYTNTNLTVDAYGRLTAASNGSGGTPTATPGTISDLILWWESDDILGATGYPLTRMRERTPWFGGWSATSTSNVPGNTKSASTLNSLPVITWAAAASTGDMTLAQGLFQASNGTGGATIFVVFNPASTSNNQAIIGGAANSLALYLRSSTSALSLVETNSAVIGTSTTTWTTSTWFQANATYNASTGAWAFRQARAAAGSGTGATGAGVGITNTFGADLSSNRLNGMSIAVIIIYNRVLSGGEITSIENYINTKWGV